MVHGMPAMAFVSLGEYSNLGIWYQPAHTAVPPAREVRGWLRSDGEYILEIRDIDPSGKVEAVYLNPKPINNYMRLKAAATLPLTAHGNRRLP